MASKSPLQTFIEMVYPFYPRWGDATGSDGSGGGFGSADGSGSVKGYGGEGSGSSVSDSWTDPNYPLRNETGR